MRKSLCISLGIPHNSLWKGVFLFFFFGLLTRSFTSGAISDACDKTRTLISKEVGQDHLQKVGNSNKCSLEELLFKAMSLWLRRKQPGLVCVGAQRSSDT